MLPFALKSFHIKNYKGIIDTQIDNIPDNTQWIFLTGENGFGKTSVLQAIVEHITDWQLGSSKGGLGLLYGGKLITSISLCKGNEFMNNKQELRAFIIKTVAYGSTRLRVSGGVTTEVTENFSSTSSLFSNDTVLINIEENFKDWKNNYSQGFEALENIFKTLLPNLSKIEVEFDENDKKSKVKYYETDLEGNKYKEGTEFLHLAAGYKNIIAMVGDMVTRLMLHQPVKELMYLHGIVVIDEIDLHLHPKYQKLFVQKLTELFPNIQFIVSTHSPIPLLGAPASSVIINVSRTREHGIKAELLDIDFSVLTPNAILSSPIFGFQDLIPDSKSDDKMIRTEDTFQEVEFNDQLKKNINEFLTEDKQKELLDLLKIKAL